MPLELVGGRCVLWVLGARDGIEKSQLVQGGWEPLFEALDVGWDVALIGPELQEDSGVHVKPGRRVYTFACLMHEASLPEHLASPSFICAFNTGIGASVVAHMKSWTSTLGQLLLLRVPVLFTCFGLHEAAVEASVFRALHARFTPHREGSFSYLLEPDKPLGVTNAMFSWACGSALQPQSLLEGALPGLGAQLSAAELFLFLGQARGHVAILADPEGAARGSWAEMHGGALLPSLKRALEEEGDDGGVQTIVRCAMKSVASSCQDALASAVLRDMGAAPLLEGFRSWAATGPWTPHDWVRAEVLERAEEIAAALRSAADGVALAEAEGAEQPFASTVVVRSSGAQVHSSPALDAPVAFEVGRGRELRTSARRGLWLRVAGGAGLTGWLLAYRRGEASGGAVEMTSWSILAWEPP